MRVYEVRLPEATAWSISFGQTFDWIEAGLRMKMKVFAASVDLLARNWFFKPFCLRGILTVRERALRD